MLRSIRDDRGVTWQVWAVLPMWVERHRMVDPTTGRERLPLPPELAGGWLAFESANGERRRIGPLPEGWEDLDDAAIARILDRARSRTPSERPGALTEPPNEPPGGRSLEAH